MPVFRSGQRVHVEYDGVVSIHGDAPWVIPSDYRHVAFQAPPGSVTIADPVDWPPHVGDIWSANGLEWFARVSSGEVLMSPEDMGATWNIDEFKTINPMLMRRRS